MFAKNFRGYRLPSKTIRWWFLLILLLSVAPRRRKYSSIFFCNFFVLYAIYFKGWLFCRLLNWCFWGRDFNDTFRKKSSFKVHRIETSNKYYEISTLYECIGKKSIIIGCNIWMICLELYSVGVGFNNFLLTDPTDIIKITSNHHRIF